MSLEKALEDLRAAVEANTAAIKGTSSSSSRASSSSEGDKAESRPRGRPRKDDDKGGSDKKVTTDKVKHAFGEYLGIDDEDEYERRAEFVKSILNEFGVDKIGDAKDADMLKAYDWLQQKLDGKRVRFDDDGGGSSSSSNRKRDLV
jgi:hypothetical protein